MTTLAEAVHLASLPFPAARVFLRECSMTPAERERFGYVEGRVVEAAILDEMAGLLQLIVESAEEKVLTLTSELENAQDEVKALQAQIHEAGVDLV